MKNFKTYLLAGCAVAVMGADMPVKAQAIDEIIVTARRQSESLRDVPASVSVITAESLERSGAATAEDFVQLTPGITIVTGTAEAGDTQINIRGMNGARDAESSVALVVDGILKTNTAQLNQDHGTVRQVEILKGPQGAIYGRNAAAGAMVLSTQQPTEALEGNIKASYGEHGTTNLSGYISGPMGDNSGFVLSGSRFETDGFYTNRFLNADVVDNAEVIGIDGRIMTGMGEATSWDIKARYAKVDSASINFRAAFHIPGFGDPFTVNVNSVDFEENGSAYYGNIVPTNEQETLEFSAKVDHEMDDMTLTAWALYSDVDQELMADGTSGAFNRYSFNATGDGAGGPWGFANPANGAAAIASDAACDASLAANAGFSLNSPEFIGTDANFGSVLGPYTPTTCDGSQFQTREQKDISFEVRLASNNDGPLQWQVGAYYLDIERVVGVSLAADLGQGVLYSLYNEADTINPTSQLFHDQFDTEVQAVFASFDYAASDDLNVGLALRYDVEDREVSNLVPVVNDPITGQPLNPALDLDGDGNLTAIAANQEEYKEFQPKLSLNYALSDESNIYANWGVGFKSGGFNNTGAAAIVTANFAPLGSEVQIADNFRKETSSSLEVGIKGTAGALTYDLAAYYTEVEDMQFFEFFVGTFGLLRVVNNIDEVEIQGVEASLDYEVSDNLSFFGSVNYLDSEITSNNARPSTIGNKSPYTAEYTLNLGANYNFMMENGMDLNARFDYRVTGPTFFHTVQGENPTLFGAPGDYSIAERDEYGVFNARIGIGREDWSVTAYARNLFDEKFLAEVIPAAEFGGSFLSPGARRQVGVEVSYSF